jgi:hypothetical protein
MKKFLFTLLAAMALVSCFAQGAAKKKVAVTIKTVLTANKTIFKPGETIPFRFEYKCPENYWLAGWGTTAYLKNIPGDFPKIMKLKINGKNPEWQNVSVSPYRWFSKAKPGNSGSISTKGWPEGDYCISITGLFREKAKGNLKTDVYRGSHLLFTLEK